MATIFPSIRTVQSDQAAPGSIIRLERSGMPLLALVVAGNSQEQGSSLVTLNASLRERSPVLLMRGWRPELSLLYDETELTFEMRIQDPYVDPRGREWWDTAGVIVSIDERIFIRAEVMERYGLNQTRLVNLRTGELYSEQEPNEAWTFGAWSLVLKGPRETKPIELCSFEIAKK